MEDGGNPAAPYRPEGRLEPGGPPIGGTDTFEETIDGVEYRFTIASTSAGMFLFAQPLDRRFLPTRKTVGRPDAGFQTLDEISAAIEEAKAILKRDAIERIAGYKAAGDSLESKAEEIH